jgi:Family of unknown function (DUF5670)
MGQPTDLNIHRRLAFSQKSGSALGHNPGEMIMLWTIVAVLLILWLLGFSLHVGGGIVHILLVVALIVIVFNLVSGRRAV